jgi:methylmalonyl-CoA/ethylmalonyl-CoA epimerase
MLKIKKISHIAVAVENLDESLEKYQRALGLMPTSRESVASQKVEAALLPIGESSIELISPQGNDGVKRFLEKRGPGLHHIALEVEDLDAAITTLKALGVPLLDADPRLGAHNHRVAFLHPKATGGVLIELVEPGHDHDHDHGHEHDHGHDHGHH